MFGCGYVEKYRGKSSTVYCRDKKYIKKSKSHDWERTCPQYFSHSIFYNSVMEDLYDYRENRLGNILDLPYPLLVYLRTANSELSRWEHYFESENIKQARKGTKK